MSVIDIFHAPRGFVFEDFETRGVLTDRGEVTLRYPVLTPETVQDLCETTRCNRSQTLAAYSVEHIVDIIGEAVELWTNPDYEGRQIAESLIPSITGYDATMTRIELKRYMRMFRRRELLRFLDDELPSPRMLDEYRPNKSGGYTRLYGPDLTFHVFSSNVPGIPVWSMTMSLLTKSAIIGKSSFDEPLMPVLFARSLTQINPDLADVLAIVPWRGGTVELEDVAIGEANAVIAYGSSHTTEAIRPRVSAGKPFLSYGARIGFSLIGREALRADTHVQTVHRMAVDVATYDQQSCPGAANHLRGTRRSHLPRSDGGTARQRARLATTQISTINPFRHGIPRHPQGTLSNRDASAVHDVHDSRQRRTGRPTGTVRHRIAARHRLDRALLPQYQQSPLVGDTAQPHH